MSSLIRSTITSDDTHEYCVVIVNDTSKENDDLYMNHMWVKKLFTEDECKTLGFTQILPETGWHHTAWFKKYSNNLLFKRLKDSTIKEQESKNDSEVRV